MADKHSLGGPAAPVSPSMSVERILRRSWLTFVLAILQLGASITVICLVRYQLESIVYTHVGPANSVLLWKYVCLLDNDGSAWACQYAYALGAISIIVSVLVFVMQCEGLMTVTGRSHMAQACVNAFGFAWWLAGAIVLSVQQHQLAAEGVQAGNSYRQGVLAMAWISVGLFIILVTMNIGMAFKIHRASMQEERRGQHPVAAPVAVPPV